MKQAKKESFILPERRSKEDSESRTRELKHRRMKSKNISKLMCMLVIATFFTSCEDWLNLYPENSQTTDQYWQTKEDVEAVVAAGYVKLQDALDEMFVWGEIRGNGIDISSTSADANIKAANKIRSMDILPSNTYADWSKMYKVINMANSVLNYAPEVLDKDDSFTESQMNSFMAEAYFQRSLAYFYLVRTFRDVPLILDPYVNDDQEYRIAKSTEDVILAKLVTDLTTALPSAKEYFPETDNDNPVYSKGRATKWAIHALLADIYLWTGDYDKCMTSCDAILSSGRIGLIAQDSWFTNFYPGNSNESIFEIQFDYDLSQTNDFMDWFSNDNKYTFSLYTYALFAESELLGDIRGDGASITSKNYRIWKYLGIYEDVTATASRESNENDQNYIIYRLADIYLMKAEALAMSGDLQTAGEWVAKVRARAGIEETFTAPATELEMLELIMDERCRELLAEGKRWFDLLRIAKRDDYKYNDYMISQVITVIPISKIAIVQSKLTDPDSHYLPISQDELDANPLLVQNPYYDSVSN